MIENHKDNWKNGIIASSIALVGSLFITQVQGVKFYTYLLLTPFIVLAVYSPVLLIELSSRISKIKKGKR